MDAGGAALALIFVGLVAGTIASCYCAFTGVYGYMHPNTSDFWQNTIATIIALIVMFIVLGIWVFIWITLLVMMS